MRILVVDDDEDIRLPIAEIIRNFGWEAQTCTNGKEALEYLEKQDFSLVFLDLVMPEMGGVETLCEIQRRKINVRTIVLSGNMTRDLLAQCKKFGARRFIEKPFEVSDIESILKGEKARS